MIQESQNHQKLNAKPISPSNEAHLLPYKIERETFLCSEDFQFKNSSILQKKQPIQQKQIKIGKVTFSLLKSTKKSNLAKFFINFYDQKFIENYNQKFYQKGPLKSSEPQLNRPNQSLTNQLTLQVVKIFHYHSVISTDQQKFCLRKTQYKQTINTFGIQILCGIRFLSLKKLDLSSQKITLIEGLSCVDAPNLEKLLLHDNKIHNLNVLSKCEFKHCRVISFSQNPVTSANLVNRSHFPKLQRVFIDETQFLNGLNLNRDQKKTQKCLQNMEFIFKLEGSTNIKQMKLNPKSRILPQKMKEKFLDINQNIKIKGNDRNEEIFQRLQQLSQIGQQNNLLQFKRFINFRIQPLLRERLATNSITQNMVTQIRARIFGQLHLLEQRVRNIQNG